MVVDASVWVAAFLQDERQNKACSDFLAAIVRQGKRAAAPMLAWPEVASAVARRTNNDQLALAAIDLMNRQQWLEAIPVTQALTQAATGIAIERRLRGADAVYLALAAQRDAVLVTLDLEILARSGPVALSQSPANWLAALEDSQS